MGVLRENLETLENPFMDTIVSHIEDLELMASVESCTWNGETNTCLLRIQPLNMEKYQDLKDLVIERLRLAGQKVPFQASCMEVMLKGAPNMIFKLTETQ